MNLQGIAEAYSQVHEKKDSSYLETDMKKRQKNNEKARKDMEKMGTSMKNPHFEEMSPDEKSMKKFQELQKNVDQKKKNIRGNDSAEQKARLEKKRGMKLDDHPQFKKEELEASGKFTAEEIEAILNVDEQAYTDPKYAERPQGAPYKDLKGFKPSAFKDMKQYPATLGGKKGMVSGDEGARGRSFRQDPEDHDRAVKQIEKNKMQNRNTSGRAAGRAAFTQNNSYEPEGNLVEGERAGIGGNRGLAQGGQRTASRGDETAQIQKKQDAQRDKENAAGARGAEFVKPAKFANLKRSMPTNMRNSYEPEGEMVEGTVTNKLRADAGPPKTTVKMSASGQEPAGDKLLRNIGNSFGNMMNRLNPKAMQSKPAGPQRKPLISTPKEEVEHYEDEFKNAIHEAYEEDIKEFAMDEIGKAFSGAGAKVADIAANHPVATAAAAGGALGALTGGKKKVKKGLGTAAGAALGAAVGGVPGAVVGGLAGNVVS